ncbi:hypothetical protein K438DRAFT_1938344 [Mycena galopus ATCC 62051]|nr:hypothetical protein K438DRAFT_1938344 [Mycena galopus ATCC 62051]
MYGADTRTTTTTMTAIAAARHARALLHPAEGPPHPRATGYQTMTATPTDTASRGLTDVQNGVTVSDRQHREYDNRGPLRPEYQPHKYGYGSGCGQLPQRPEAREEQLRQTALGTIAARNPRTVFPPSAVLVVKTEHGHPVFPLHLAKDEDACMGSNAGLSHSTQYSEGEANRHAQAMANTKAAPLPRTTMELNSQQMGVWAAAKAVATFDKAVNLCRWVHHSDAQAMEYFKWEITGLHDPTIPHHGHQCWACARQWTSIGPLQPRARSHPRQEEDVVMTGADTELEDIAPEPRAHLGLAMQNSDTKTSVYLAESPTKAVRGSDVAMTTLRDTVKAYWATPAAQWPISMRVTPTTVAELTGTTAPPLASDITAWLTINALAPIRGELTAEHRNTFLWETIRILSVSGYFAHCATLGQYPPDDLPLKHYLFNTTALRSLHIVS